MAKHHKSLEQEVEALITQEFAQQEEAHEEDESSTAQPDAQAQETAEAEPRVISVDKYDLPGGETLLRLPDGRAVLLPPGAADDRLDEGAVEGTVESDEAEAAFPPQLEPLEPRAAASAPAPSKATPPVSPKQRGPVRWLVPTALLLLAALALLGGGLLALWPQFGPSATITLVPSMQQVRAHTTITVVTTTATHLGQQQIPGRELPTFTLSQQTTVPTTGTRWQQAQVARGRITFYNAAPSPQTIAAGTLLTGADGVQVVTEQDAFLPAGTLATNGQVSVRARAVAVGPAGNIQANDIYGACCRENVFAQNEAFTGGQDARLLRVVSAHDWQSALSPLKSSLQASVQAAFVSQVQPAETLLEPVACTSTVTANHQVGDEASQFQMTLDEQCHGTVYQTQALLTLVSQAVTAAATRQIGGQGYRRVGELGVHITKSSPGAQGTLTLAVQVSGTWAYQPTMKQIRHLAQVLAGKSVQQARTLLLQQAGVAQVEMNVESGTLPTAPDHIHLIVLEAGSQEANS